VLGMIFQPFSIGWIGTVCSSVIVAFALWLKVWETP
jgi:hypothetical protein